MSRVRAARLILSLAPGLLAAGPPLTAQVSRQAPKVRSIANGARTPVFSGAHPGAASHAMAALPVPPIPATQMMQMTTYSLPGSDVHSAGGTIRLSASQPVAANGRLSVAGATTQPVYGQDGSILFDDLGHREAGTVRLTVHLSEAGKPHVLDCSTVNKPGIDWEVKVGSDLQVVTPGSAPFTAQHLSAIIVPAEPGEFEITLHPKLAAPRSDYVYTTLGYCAITVLH